MDAKQKSQSRIDRRRKKQTKQQKDDEHLSKITDALNTFLKAQNTTPEVYNEHIVYTTTIQKRFYDLCKYPQLTLREFVSVNILNGNSPKELYLMRKLDEQKAVDFHRALKDEYTSTEYPLVHCMKPGLICVAKSAKNGWQRCRIIKLHENSTADALLFDIGMIERIDWNDLRIIPEKFTKIKPLAVRCSLVNVLTAQPIERFSMQHHQHFQQILMEQNDFYAFINRPNELSSDIFLYYKSEENFHCVNNVFPVDTFSEDSSVEDEITSEAIAIRNSSSAKSNTKSESEPVQDSSQIAPSSFELEPSKALPTNGHVANGNGADDIVEEEKPFDELIESRITHPWNIVVKHVVGIDEIYVCFVKYLEVWNRLRFDVLTYIEKESPTTKDAWKVGDFCLAKDPDDGSGEWLRGKIVKIPASDRHVTVFLRDVGKTIECKANDLKVISKELQMVRDCTWKVKLTSIKMLENCTPSMMKNLLCDLIELNEETAMSAVGDNNGNDLCIILWGVKKVFKALLPERIEYVNINELLVERGFAAFTASFRGVTNKFNPSQENSAALPNSVDEDQENIDANKFLHCDSHLRPLLKIRKYKMVSDQRMEVVKRWLPSERIDEKKFVAFPMYVSQHLIISVLEATRKTACDEIKEILEKKYRNGQLERKDSVEWKKEDACFARFEDCHFYRATVRRVNYAKNTCVVRFIDYGNCDTCSLDDLRKATLFGDIPILARQYQLYNVQPTTSNGLWPDHVRNYCTNLIIDHHCDLIVIGDDDDQSNGAAAATPDVEYCRLDLLTKEKDLASALLARGHAQLIHREDEHISF